VCIVAGCNDDDSDYLSFTLSGLIDSALENGLLSAPIVTYVVSKDQLPDDLKANGWCRHHLELALKSHFDEYSLAEEMLSLSPLEPWKREPARAAHAPSGPPLEQLPPTFLAQLDGASVESYSEGGETTAGEKTTMMKKKKMMMKKHSRWDVSTVAVFDGAVPEALRNELLQHMARPDGSWDPEDHHGPDPEVWRSTGLSDVPLLDDVPPTFPPPSPKPSGNKNKNNNNNGMLADDLLLQQQQEDVQEEGKKVSTKGLCPETLNFLCSSPPQSGAIAAFEDVLKRQIFPNHIVCRLPGAVFGDGVSFFISSCVGLVMCECLKKPLARCIDLAPLFMLVCVCLALLRIPDITVDRECPYKRRIFQLPL
jgi:hypothetical protein